MAGVADGNGLVDVYSYAVAAGTLSLVSHLPSDSMTAADSHPSSGSTPSTHCSSDGGTIAFYGDSSSLVAGFVPGNARSRSPQAWGKGGGLVYRTYSTISSKQAEYTAKVYFQVPTFSFSLTFESSSHESPP